MCPSAPAAGHLGAPVLSVARPLHCGSAWVLCREAPVPPLATGLVSMSGNLWGKIAAEVAVREALTLKTWLLHSVNQHNIKKACGAGDGHPLGLEGPSGSAYDPRCQWSLPSP